MSTYFLYILHFIYKNTIFEDPEDQSIFLKRIEQCPADAFREIIKMVL